MKFSCLLRPERGRVGGFLVDGRLGDGVGRELLGWGESSALLEEILYFWLRHLCPYWPPYCQKSSLEEGWEFVTIPQIGNKNPRFLLILLSLVSISCYRGTSPHLTPVVGGSFPPKLPPLLFSTDISFSPKTFPWMSMLCS